MTDHHAQRYAAGEALAKAARTIATEWSVQGLPGMRDRWMEEFWLPALEAALVEYERTKDHP